MTVNNVNALLSYAKGQPDLMSGRTEETAKGSFEKVMSQVNGKADTVQTKAPGTNASAAQTVVSVDTSKNTVTSVKAGQQETGSTDKSENTVHKETDENVTGDTGASSETNAGDTAAEKLEKSGEELVEDIAEEMDVTREDVEAAMAMLGLTAIELFDPDNLRQLLLAISGNQDELSLLTDETLYGNLQDLLGTLGESLEYLQKELGLSEEELKELMNRMLSEQEESGMTEAETGVDLEGMKDYTVSVQKDGETVKMKVTVDDASGNKSVQESVTNTFKAEVQPEQKMQQDASADSGKEGNSAGNAMLQAPEMPVQVNEAPEAAAMEYRSLQTEQIMNQIVEYMKINLKADTQTMELQLHPASLGTVNVQLMAKEGGLTAHFTTQNEAVRAVIETQLIQLKNQFEEQGIKVDAVEVTVANHAYGQQFSQDNENTGQEQSKAGKGRRNINLDQIESEEELEGMEDSERIAVEMMQASGSTVDYTA